MKVVVNVEDREVIKEESFVEYVKETINNGDDGFCSLFRLFPDFLDEKKYNSMELFLLSQHEKEQIIEEFAASLINGYDEDLFFSAEL